MDIMISTPVCLATFVWGVPVLFLLVLLYCQISKIAQSERNIPAGSRCWPLIGETISFLKPHRSNTIGEFLESHCARYGRIFKSHLFGSPTIVSCDAELNSFIFQNEERLFQSSYPGPLHAVLGETASIIVVGDLHRRLRAVTVAFATTYKTSNEYLHNAERHAASLMESWKGKHEVVFCKEAKKFTFNVILKQVLNMEPEEPIAVRILEDFLILMKGLVSFPLNIPGSQYGKAVKARARVSSAIKEILRQRRSTTKGGHQNAGDFLSVLLSNDSLSDEERVSLVFDLLLGGNETTSTLLALVLYFLSQSPVALQQLKEEHQAIRRKNREKNDEYEHLNWEDYKQMEFTQNVIQETLRCGNIVKFVHRKALVDVKYKRYLIPRGWKVLPIFTAIHLDPSLHKNATEFYPWRWKEHISSKAATPFSGGMRLCPGADLAKVETAVFLHHLLVNFRWTISTKDDHPMAHPYVEFKSGLPLKIQPLQQ